MNDLQCSFMIGRVLNPEGGNSPGGIISGSRIYDYLHGGMGSN
jgi:hypothetical protein